MEPVFARFMSGIVALVALIGVASCGSGGDGSDENAEACDTPSATLEGATGIQACVFTRSCTFSSCHGASGSPAAGLSLKDGDACHSLVNAFSSQITSRKLVEPFQPEASYLYMKLIGDPSIEGERMPLNSGALEDRKIDAIRQWIKNGSQCN